MIAYTEKEVIQLIFSHIDIQKRIVWIYIFLISMIFTVNENEFMIKK